MLQYYILMRMKNKMKDFEAEYEEWWEEVEEYFTKDLENNLIQHKAKMKRQKQRQVEQIKRRKCRLKNHMTSKVEQLKYQ